jgi:capsular polysaccharide biosynthesis protein
MRNRWQALIKFVDSLGAGTFERAASVRSTPSLVEDYQILQPAYTLAIDDSRFTEFLSHTKWNQDGRHTFRERFICRIPNALVNVKKGAVALPDHTLLEESAMAGEKKHGLEQGKILGSPIARRVRKLSGTYTTIMNWNQRNYYHWLIENLTRLYPLMSVAPTPQLLLPPQLLPHQQATLDVYLPPSMPVCRFEDDWVQVENLIFASHVYDRLSGYIPAEFARWLRQTAYQRFGLSEQPQPQRRLYISRRDCATKRTLNEAEVIACLNDFDFEVIQPEKMTFEEQVRLFHDAALVVGVHGAGLTNLMFAGKIPVLEFNFNPIAKTLFFYYTYALEQPYHWLFVEQQGTDIVVDAARLRDKLQTILTS